MADRSSSTGSSSASKKRRSAGKPRAPRVLGYCTNVHAGVTLEETRSNLERHATLVREQYCPRRELPIGLWLPAKAAQALLQNDELPRFRDWLAERRLRVFTLNGFPQGDFHQAVVKRAVYRPRWSDLARLNYTRDLIHIMAELTPPGGEGSISSLPIGWKTDLAPRDQHAAASLIHDTVRIMADLEHRQQKYIHLDLEPEPGCLLETAQSTAEYFRVHVFSHPDFRLARRHVRICHDICHAAVMFEDPRDMLAKYDKIGATIGKVQISSAVRAGFDELDPKQREPALNDLRAFAEPKYLHQTSVRESPDSAPDFYEDLPEALDSAAPAGEWRVHYHVPVYLERLGAAKTRLGTTRDTIAETFALLRERPDVRHFEVETYAWNVLPESLQHDELADGIAQELEWTRKQMTAQKLQVK